MPKQVGVILFQNDWDLFKKIVPEKSRIKVFEAYLFQTYRLPDDFSGLSKKRVTGTVSENLRLSEDALLLIDNYVQTISSSGIKTNRSIIIRDVIKGYILNHRHREDDSLIIQEKRHVTYYFERGTRDILNQLIGHRHRSSQIEHFILSKELDYSLLSSISLKNNAPAEIESIRMNLNQEAVEVIDSIAQSQKDKIASTAVMREVVSQLIQKLSGKPYSELLMEYKLKNVLDQYTVIVGSNKVEEKVSEYLKNR